MHFRLFLAALALTALSPTVPGCLAQPAATTGAEPNAKQSAEPESDADDVRRARAARRLQDLERATPSAPARELPALDPSLLAVYEQTVRDLAAEEMGGRAPGTPGIELAADLIDTRFRALGLEPAFTDDAGAPTYRQTFERGTEQQLQSSALSINNADPLVFDQDYSVLGLSGSGDFEGPVTFVGYSVVSGPGGYLGYPATKQLNGRVALLLRFEPHDDKGESRWSGDGWSFNAALQSKVGAAVRRGARAVLVVNPTTASDPRIDRLETIDSTRGSVTFEVPVLMITPEHAEALVRAGDPEGRSFEDLIALANERGTVVDFDDAVTVSASAEIEDVSITTDNVGAVLPGRGALADEYVVIGAHYDHVGLGLFASRSPERAGEVHPGADDNASGTAGVLLAAEILAERHAALDPDADTRSVVFLAFTAEESGLIGSRYYADNPPVAIENHVAMLNMDMIGRMRSNTIEVGGTKTSPDLETVARPHLDATGLGWDFDLSIGSGRSDHASFDAVGVPCMFVFTGLHDEYHTADDTVDLVNFEGGARIASAVADIAHDLATRADRPRHEDAGPTRGAIAEQRRPRVRVGIVPADAPSGGIRLERVFDNTSAADAGLERGDVITAWDGEPTDSVDDWLPILLDHEPGDTVTLTIQRDGEELEVDMTLKAPG